MGFADAGECPLEGLGAVGGKQRLQPAGRVGSDDAVTVDGPYQRVDCVGVDRRKVGCQDGDDVRVSWQRAQPGGQSGQGTPVRGFLPCPSDSSGDRPLRPYHDGDACRGNRLESGVKQGSAGHLERRLIATSEPATTTAGDHDRVPHRRHTLSGHAPSLRDDGRMRVALVQLAAGLDPSANLADINRLASGRTADLIILPEAVMHDFGPIDTRLGPVAQDLDGPFVTALAELAWRVGATVIAGMFERSGDPDRPYNTLVAVGADGTLLAAYRKIHLYDSFGYRESDRLMAGELTATVIPVGDHTVGLMTCYDLRFPEHSRALVDAGATLLAVPAAWVRGPLKEDHWLTLLRARAIENTVYVAAAAQCGRQYCGQSALIDPLGVAVVALGADEGVAIGEIDQEWLAAVRARNPALQHRRWPGPDVAPART